MNIKYLKKIDERTHVSNDLIFEFENLLPKDTLIKDIKKCSYDDLLLRINFKLPYLKIPIFRNEITFSMLMGVGDFRFFLGSYKTHKINAVYLFDAWPIHYDYIKFACNSLNIKYLFCSSIIAAENLQKILKHTKVIWQPEAIDASSYKNKDYAHRTIDVLQFGRKYEKIQDRLKQHLKELSIDYVYQKDKLIFSTRRDFIEGLASSKISLCFPRSITNPEIAHGQETMTVRYLQSMASKTLVVGKCPEEMKLLFSYNPVIELDLSNPGEHIRYLLNNYQDYLPLIEKNYQEVINNHQWTNRWNEILKVLMN